MNRHPFPTYLLCTAFMISIHPARDVRADEPAVEKHTLTELVESALKHTPTLSAQEAREGGSRWSASQARIWPGFSLEAVAGRRKADQSGPLYEVAVSQPLPLLGKLGLRGRVLELESEAWGVRRTATEIEVRLSVVQSAFEYAVNRRRAAFIEGRHKRFEVIREYLAGREFPTPQRKAESRIVRAHATALVSDRILSQAAFKASFEKLKVYAPLDPGPYPEVEVPWLAGEKTLNHVEWRTRALKNNPGILLQRLAVKAAALERTLAGREGLPETALAVSYEEATAGGTEKNFGLGVHVDLPPWNRNRAGVKSADRKKTAEEKQLAFDERKLGAELTRLLIEYDAARAVARQYPAALLEESESQMDESERGFRKGQVDLLTFLEIDDSVAETCTRALDAQRDLATAWAALMALAGEREALSSLESL